MGRPYEKPKPAVEDCAVQLIRLGCDWCRETTGAPKTFWCLKQTTKCHSVHSCAYAHAKYLHAFHTLIPCALA